MSLAESASCVADAPTRGMPRSVARRPTARSMPCRLLGCLRNLLSARCYAERVLRRRSKQIDPGNGKSSHALSGDRELKDADTLGRQPDQRRANLEFEYLDVPLLVVPSAGEYGRCPCD